MGLVDRLEALGDDDEVGRDVDCVAGEDGEKKMKGPSHETIAIVGDPDDRPAALVDLAQGAVNGPDLSFALEGVPPAPAEYHAKLFVDPSMARRGLRDGDYTFSEIVRG